MFGFGFGVWRRRRSGRPAVNPTPGTVILGGSWTDQTGTRPQWGEGSRTYDQPAPSGWVRTVQFQWWGTEQSAGDNAPVTLVDAVAAGQFANYSFEQGGYFVQYRVLLVRAGQADRDGDWRNAGNSDVSDVVGVSLNGFPTISLDSNIPSEDTGTIYANLDGTTYDTPGNTDWSVSWALTNATAAVAGSPAIYAWGAAIIQAGVLGGHADAMELYATTSRTVLDYLGANQIYAGGAQLVDSFSAP